MTRAPSFQDFLTVVFEASSPNPDLASTLYLRLKRRERVRLGSSQARCIESRLQEAEFWLKCGSAPVRGAGMFSVPVVGLAVLLLVIFLISACHFAERRGHKSHAS